MNKVCGAVVKAAGDARQGSLKLLIHFHRVRNGKIRYNTGVFSLHCKDELNVQLDINRPALDVVFTSLTPRNGVLTVNFGALGRLRQTLSDCLLLSFNDYMPFSLFL